MTSTIAIRITKITSITKLIDTRTINFKKINSWTTNYEKIDHFRKRTTDEYLSFEKRETIRTSYLIFIFTLIIAFIRTINQRNEILMSSIISISRSAAILFTFLTATISIRSGISQMITIRKTGLINKIIFSQ
jgi:hypothetical protein